MSFQSDFDPGEDDAFDQPFKKRSPKADAVPQRLRFKEDSAESKRTLPTASVFSLGSYDSQLSKSGRLNLANKSLTLSEKGIFRNGSDELSLPDWQVKQPSTIYRPVSDVKPPPSSWKLPNASVLQGHLSRRKGLRRKWIKELFAVQHNVLLICPTESPFLIGLCIPLISIQKVEANKNDLLLTITYLAPQKKGAAVVTILVCRAENRGERDHWVSELGRLQRAAIAKNMPIGGYVDRDAAEKSLHTAFINWRSSTTTALALTAGRLIEYKQRELMRFAILHWRDTIQKENLKAAKATAASVEGQIAARSAALEKKLAAAQTRAQRDRRIMIACDRLRLYEKHLKHFSLLRLKRQADSSVTENLATGAASLLTYTWRQHAELLARETIDFRKAKISAVFNALISRRLRLGFDRFVLLAETQADRRRQRSLLLMQLISHKENTITATKRRILEAFQSNTSLWQRRSDALLELLRSKRKGQIGGAVRRWYYFCIQKSTKDVSALERLAFIVKSLQTKSLSNALRAIAKAADDSANLQTLQVASNLSLVNSKLLDSFDTVPRHRACGIVLCVLNANRRNKIWDAFRLLQFHTIRKRLYCKAVALLAAILNGGKQRRLLQEPFRVWLEGTRVASVWWREREMIETKRQRSLNILVGVLRSVLVKLKFGALTSLRRAALIKSAELEKSRYLADCANEKERMLATRKEQTEALEMRLETETQALKARLETETQRMNEALKVEKEFLLSKFEKDKEKLEAQTHQEKEAAVQEAKEFLQRHKDAVEKGQLSLMHQFAEKIEFWFVTCRTRRIGFAFRQLQLAALSADVLRSIARLHMTQRIVTLLDRQRVVALTLAWQTFKEILLNIPRKHERKMMEAVETLNEARAMAEHIEARRLRDQMISPPLSPSTFTFIEEGNLKFRRKEKGCSRAAKPYKRRKKRKAGRRLLAMGLCLPSMKFRWVLQNRRFKPVNLQPDRLTASVEFDNYSDSVARALKDAELYLDSERNSEACDVPMSHRSISPVEHQPCSKISSSCLNNQVEAENLIAAYEELSQSETIGTPLSGNVFMEKPPFIVSQQRPSHLSRPWSEDVEDSSDLNLRELQDVLEDFAQDLSTVDASSSVSYRPAIPESRDLGDLQEFLLSTRSGSDFIDYQLPFETGHRTKKSRRTKKTKELLAELEVIALGGVRKSDSSSGKLSSRSLKEVIRLLEDQGYTVAAPEPLQRALFENSVGGPIQQGGVATVIGDPASETSPWVSMRFRKNGYLP